MPKSLPLNDEVDNVPQVINFGFLLVKVKSALILSFVERPKERKTFEGAFEKKKNCYFQKLVFAHRFGQLVKRFLKC